MMLPVRYSTILLMPLMSNPMPLMSNTMPLMSNIMLTLTLSMVTAMACAIMTSMVMTMVVILAMAKVTMISPMMAMTIMMSMMVTMFSVFFYRWGSICIRLCICFLFALLWGIGSLWKNEERRNGNKRDFSV